MAQLLKMIIQNLNLLQMKAILTPVLLLLAAFTMTAQEHELYFVSAETTDLRSGPGTNYNIVTQLSKGMQVDLISEDFGEWWTVQYRTMNGFVKASDLLAVMAAVPQQQQQQQQAPPPVAQQQYTPPPANDSFDDWEDTALETGDELECLNISPQYDYKLDNYLKIDVSQNTEAVVKLIKVGDNPSEELCYRLAYIQSGDTYHMKNIPSGKYYLKIAYGEEWKQRTVNGKCIGRFVRKALYKMGDQILNFTPVRLAQGMDVPSFELSLDVSTDGTGNSFDTDDISEEFFNN